MVKEDSLTVIKISLKLRIVVNRARLWRSGRALDRSHRRNNLSSDYRRKRAGKSTNSKTSLRINRRTHMRRSRVEIEPPRRRGGRWHREDARNALAKKLLLEKIYKTAINKKKEIFGKKNMFGNIYSDLTIIFF